jgi:acetolactate synthase-1/2/3 large subunit
MALITICKAQLFVISTGHEKDVISPTIVNMSNFIGPERMSGIMKLSDYIADYIASLGVRHVFTLPGGFSMHLNDSIAHHPKLTPVYMLHEAGAAIAAEAYAKASGGIGVCVVTAGPGCTNALTGVASAWLDSTPLLVISGDARMAHLKARDDFGLRQGGPQDIDIMQMIRPITKHSFSAGPRFVDVMMNEAVKWAMEGRRGPIWIDIPLDVQAAQIEPKATRPDIQLRHMLDVTRVITLLKESKRPIILAGAGVQNSRDEFLRLIDLLQVPVLTTWAAMDLIDYDHPLFIGRPGVVAARGANFALQNADLILAIGARLDPQTIGFERDQFAPNAKKIMVDIDQAELDKLGDMYIDLPICADAGDFIRAMLATCYECLRPEWLAYCQDWKERYPFTGNAETYHMIDMICELSTPDDVFVVSPSCMAGAIFMAGFHQKAGQRIISSHGLGAMGWATPAAIGAALATGRRVTVIDGDGSFAQNVQELEVMRRLNLPIRFFVFNNDGYASIRNSQNKAFGRLSGADESSGLSLPNIEDISRAYHIDYGLLTPPSIFEFFVPRNEMLAPRVQSEMLPDGTWHGGRLDDMWPYLTRDEYAENMQCLT